MKRYLHIAIVFLIMINIISTSYGQRGSTITTVVIDAGHGGKDPGAVGKHSKEKDITLAVALKTGKYIEENFSDVKVIYTRKTDEFIELYKRAEIANKNSADFFISIHCNSNKSSSPYGSETYVMGLHKNDANLNVAMKENAAILLEEDYSDQYEGFNANSPESYIKFSLIQDTYLEQSSDMANRIQQQFKNRVGRKDRGVYQAGFLVLWRTAMPGVLIELGFLSNPAEEKFLMSNDGQVFMASAIYRAFKEYKIDYEKENNKETISENKEVETKTETIEYRVQFYTSPTELDVNSSKLKGITEVSKYYHNGLYKYTSGHFSNLNDASNHQALLRKKGYDDAFVVAFKNGERISQSEAAEIENKKINR
ncbi:MAG TPA: N-acetylmuramoyl-L-alanine amidase [Bacteroidales bacterium]